MSLPAVPFVCESINLEAAERVYFRGRPTAQTFEDHVRDIIAAALGETIPVEVESEVMRSAWREYQRYITAWQPVSGDSV